MQVTLAHAKKDPHLLPFRFALKAYIADERLRIPVLPDVVTKVISLLNHPNSDANTLARHIHKDQALASYVLRVSNSPLFAGTREITTLRQAVARIGAKALGKIALSVTMQGKIFKAAGYEKEIKGIWREALTCGVFAQEIGCLINVRSESLYLCGLLHTIGKPVILQALDELKTEFDMELLHESGLALMIDFHQVVGRKVAEQWKLPGSIRYACMNYLDPEGAQEFKKEVRITFLAHRLAGYIDANPEEEDLEALADHPSVRAIGIRVNHLRDLCIKLDRIRALLETMEVVH